MEPEGSLPRSQQPAIGPHPVMAHFIVILPSTHRASKWPLSFTFSNHNVLCIYQFSHVYYTTRPSHPRWLDHPRNIWWSVQVM